MIRRKKWALVLLSALLSAQIIMDAAGGVNPASDPARPLLAVMALALAKMIDRDEKRSGR